MLTKKIPALFVFAVCFSFIANAQQQQPQPQLLKEPAAWTFERFALPPVFAPDFPYKGAEELRFSPGMFNKNSTDYFTYAFVAELDGITTISQNNIRDYLLAYFKGLCSSTAKERKLVIDTAAITVSVNRKEDTPGNEIIYNALLNVFGVFADGAPVTLNMEVKALKDASASKVYLVFIASPLEKTDNTWLELYTIQKEFVVPVP